MVFEVGSSRFLAPGLGILVRKIPWSFPRVWAVSHGNDMNSPSLLQRWRPVLSLPVMRQFWGGGRSLYQGRGLFSGGFSEDYQRIELSAEQHPNIMIQYFLTKFDSDSFLQYKGDNSWPMCIQEHLDLQANLLPAFGAPGGWCSRD